MGSTKKVRESKLAKLHRSCLELVDKIDDLEIDVMYFTSKRDEATDPLEKAQMAVKLLEANRALRMVRGSYDRVVKEINQINC